jgi:hypothetical protein
MSRKFIVIGAPRAHGTAEALSALLVPEIEAVWRDYRSGLIREIYERADARGVIMVCEADTRDQVEQMAADLPLTKAGFLDIQILELKPFEMWQTLFANRVD